MCHDLATLLRRGDLSVTEMMATDLDGTCVRLQAGGADVSSEPTEQPYGVRDCAFRDPRWQPHPHPGAALSP